MRSGENKLIWFYARLRQMFIKLSLAQHFCSKIHKQLQVTTSTLTLLLFASFQQATRKLALYS